MTLDLAAISTQIREMAATLDPEYDAERFQILRSTWETLDSHGVNQRFSSAKSTFLLPQQTDDFKARSGLPDLNPNYTVVGTDGSFILPDRHSPARYYLLNTGIVAIRYGDEPVAQMTAQPKLYFREEDLYVSDDLHRIPINSNVIGPLRAVSELQAAAELLRDVDGPTVGLQDGTLILWSLESQHDTVVQWVLPRFLNALRTLRDREQPVAGYISAPGATELVNTLRIAICDYPDTGMAVNCDHCRGRIRYGHKPKCDVLPQVTDSYLMRDIADLKPGQRSAIYGSTSKVLQRYIAEHDADLDICFFYLNTETEIARVEVPRWVVNDRRQLDLVQCVVIDQCRLGRGYPIVLQEAHEMAVLSIADRRLVEDTVERALARIGIVINRTGKDGSKRVRYV